MTIVTTRPDATIANGSSNVSGAATRHAATSDNSDASWVELTGSTPCVLGFAEPTIPGGAAVMSIALRARCQLGSFVGGNPILRTKLSPPGSTVDTIVSWGTVITITVDTETYSFVPSPVEVEASEVSSWDSVPRLYELYVDTTYVGQPVCVVNAPTGTITDNNTPLTQWTPTLDSSGDVQTYYEVKIFDTATFSGGTFDPNTSTPDSQSGILASSDSTWSSEDVLSNDTYRAYVRIAQTVNGNQHWSDWAFSGFVLNVPSPTAPVSITTTVENGNGRIKVETAEGAGGTVITDYYEIQRSNDSGTTWEDIRTSDGINGKVVIPTVVAMAGTADAADGTTHTVALPAPGGGILGGDLLVALAAFDGNPTITWPSGWTEIKDEAGNGSALRVGAAYKYAVGGETGNITITTSASEGGGVRIICVRGAHPTTAPEISAGVNGSGTSGDPDALNPTNWSTENTLWVAAVGNDGNVAISSGPSDYFDFANTRWANASGAGVATAVKRAEVASEDPGTFTLASAEDSRAFTAAFRPWRATPFEYDYEAPVGLLTRYRVRSVHQFASGGTSSSAWVTSGDVIFESTAWWLKHPYDASLNFASRVRSQPGKSRSSRVGIHQPLNRSDAVAIRDKDEPWQGDLVVRLDTDEDRTALHALLANGAPILVQSPPDSYNWDDKWIVVTSVSDDRAVDTDIRPWSFTSIQWTEVARPTDTFL